jgi:hypothetical protein
MGLVFRELTKSIPVIRQQDTVRLTSGSIKFLRSLGFKVQDVGHRK